MTVTAGSHLLIICLAAQAVAADVTIHPDKANSIELPATEARYVRMVILASYGGQPCIDELEVYGPDDKANLALASTGAKATASSCLAGYNIHRIAHLNDGLYGNNHSWIAAGFSGEWAQIELPRPVTVNRVEFSRDRTGRFRDRVAVHFEILLSLDGKQWKSVRSVKAANVPAPARAPFVSRTPTPYSDFVIPSPSTVGPLDTSDAAVSEAMQKGDLLGYAFLCEARMAAKIDSTDPSVRVLKQFSDMIDRFAARGLDVTKERSELAALRQRQGRLGAASEGDMAAAREVFFDARLAKRQLMMRDPELAPLAKVLFVKRHPFLPSHNYSVIFDAQGGPGGAVCVLDIPGDNGRLVPEKAKIKELFESGAGIARDPVASFDLGKICFGYRKTKSDYFHLMVMDGDGGNPIQVTDGPFHDYFPCPLPDGGLAFISTRCKARYLCWRPQAFVLFRMDADGGNIRPLSYANVSEWTPSLMPDGRIIWMRSEYIDKGANFGHTLWAIRPDGTHPELVFGNDTHNCYANGRPVPGTSGREICCTLVAHGGDLNGPIALIDLTKGPFNPEAIRKITPDVPAQYNMSWIRNECFRDPVPVSRDYILCSHAPYDRFGLWVIDRHGNREMLYLDPSIGSMCPTPLAKIDPPPAMAEMEPSRSPQGQFVVADVYQGMGPQIQRGQVKYLRVCEEVRAELIRLPNGEYQKDHEPFMDWYATPVHKVSGPLGWPSYVAKATHGIVPVEADGSANFYAPAGKVLYFQALDKDFNELQRMRSVVQLQPGEVRGCIGCHEERASAPPRQPATAAQREASPIEPPPWGAGPFAYEKVVQPVWDAKCVSCHDAKDKDKINLTGTLDADRVPASYRTIISRGWVHYFDWNYGVQHNLAEAGSFGTLKSKLWKVLDAGHYDVKLTTEQMRRVKCWIDLNCPLWPNYQFRPERAESAVASSR
jgi:hypothetical protein